MYSAIGYKVPFNNGQSVHVEESNRFNFCDAVHFHDEYQLTYILDGQGKLIVGNRSYTFGPGDAYLFGSNLPHVFENKKKAHAPLEIIEARHISIFFSESCLNPFFAQVPEAFPIKTLLSYAAYGLKFNDNLSVELRVKLKQLCQLDNLLKVLELLDVLEWISKDIHSTRLATEKISGLDFDKTGVQKIMAIFAFIERIHDQKILVSDIAGQFNMTTSTFCRFFKLRSGKTFSRYLTEIRIVKACELIRNGTHNVTESCFGSGFTNLSNFNRHFKNRMGMTPSRYKSSISTFVN